MSSTLVIHDIATGEETVVLQTEWLIEAPNWSPDGRFLVVNGGGRIYRVELNRLPGELVEIPTEPAHGSNNDHGISPDGTRLAVSSGTGQGTARIYTVPITGGPLKPVTEAAPSYWHGWSPDGGTLTYTARRDGIFNIFTIPVDGGPETQLTFGPGHKDGPDYTPDGDWIWFNSDHGGSMDLWRIRPDGSGLQRMTHDDNENWFPHPAPDGASVLFLAYAPGVEWHPRHHQVELKLMPPEGGTARTIVSLFGGQGTINVPCWAPDGSRFAYARYDRFASPASSTPAV